MSVYGFNPQTLKNLIIAVYRMLASKIDSYMLLYQRIASKAPRPLTIILIALAFGALAFLYSFIGLFSNKVNNIITFDAFGSLTPQEIGGHFLFGYVVALPTRNLKMGVLSGLMALTIDADHLLNTAGFDIQARMGHSVSFAILSSVLIGLMVSQISRKVSVWNGMMSTESLPSGKKKKTMVYTKSVHNSLLPPERKDIFSQYLIITLAAFISHIAYDVFVNAGASFPLLAPPIFSDFFIPQIYALPIEAAAILLVYLWYYTFKKIYLI